MPDLGAIPWVGVLVAIVASQVIGFLWYGPLFGKPWLAAMGKTKEEMAAGGSTGPAITVGVLCSVATAIALAIILTMSATPDMASGAKVGLLGAVIVAAYIETASVYERRPPALGMIAMGYSVVMLVVMGAIIGAMW